MTDLAQITRKQLTEEGLVDKDIEAFIEVRSRVGSPGKENLSAGSGLSAQGRKILLALLKKSEEQEPVYNPLPQLGLTVRPEPAMASRGQYLIRVLHHRHVDKEAFVATRPFSMRGPSNFSFHDVSLEHVIEIEIVGDDEEVVYTRTFIPPVRPDGDWNDLDNRWFASPPLQEGETLGADDPVVYSTLRFITTRRPHVDAFDSIPSNRFLRAGQFQVIGNPEFRFDGYQLSYALVAEDEAERLAQIADKEAGSGWALSLSNADNIVSTLLSALALSRGELDFEGSFKLEQTSADIASKIGWMWVLTGPTVFAGYRPDSRLAETIDNVVIFLKGAEQNANATGVPFDVSEQALLNRPEVFADDPGSNCRPFENPARILGEKRFSTILRVTQPHVEKSVRRAVSFDDQVVREVDYPRAGLSEHNRLDYEDKSAMFQAKSVAIGHVLEHAVRWRSNGYSLGDIAYSMTLAPRQKRRILKLDYTRRERNMRQDSVVYSDSVSDQLVSERGYENSVASELGEWSRGQSKASSSSAAVGIGLPIGPAIVGGGAVTGTSSSSSSQQGGRNVAAREAQSLRDAIRRFGQSLRSQETTVVTETSQSETIEGVSEVVQNINYTRALSVVYYEILRHLRVDTEVAGVSECIFVPLEVKPFTDERIRMHQQVLSRYARGYYERKALTHLDEVLAGFDPSEIPEGPRNKQPLQQLSGTLYLQAGIEMPADGPEMAEINKNTDRTVYEREVLRVRTAIFGRFSSVFPVPTPLIVERTLHASDQERNRYFQREIAPHMMRHYVNDISLETDDGNELAADLTLVSDYVYGRSLRVDFTVANVDSLTRANLDKIVVKLSSDTELPARSYIHVRSAQLRYSNEHYKDSVNSDSGYRDLVNSETGMSDDEGALLFFAPNSNDLVNYQDRLTEAYKSFRERLNEDSFRYHKVIWWSLDADELYTLLDGYSISDEDGRSLASICEHRPVAIMGNSLVFRTNTDKPLDPMFDTFADMKNHYTGELPKSDPMRISLPTDGLYARAHLDGCVAAEEHNGSFDWVFDNVEPELADFPANVFDSRRAEPQGMQPSKLPDTIINLQNAPEAPKTSGLSDILATVSNPDAFRDMAGLAGTQENLRAAMSSASKLAGDFGGMALQRQLAQIQADATAGRDLKSISSAIDSAIDKKLATPELGAELFEQWARRRAAEDPSSRDNRDMAQQWQESVVQGGGGGEVSHTDETGTTTARINPPAASEPTTRTSVVPIPPDKILFMNFATNSDRLNAEHLTALEKLVGQVGLKLDNVLRIEGHASRAGSDEHNEALARRRANNLFAALNRLMHPLQPNVNFTPNFVFSEGENGSYRADFRGIRRIDEVPGAGHRNDPVEKAVLLTVGGDFAEQSLREFDFYGVRITITNQIVIIGNYAVYSRPGGDLTVYERNSMEVVQTLTHTATDNSDNSDNSSDNSGNRSVNVGGDVRVAAGGNGIIITGSGNTVSVGCNADGSFENRERVSNSAAEKPYSDWVLHFRAPTVTNEVSLAEILDRVINQIKGLPQNPDTQSTTLVGQLYEMFASEAQDALDILLTQLGINSFKDKLDIIRFGTVAFEGKIKARDDSSVAVSGTFVGPGIVIGTATTSSDVVVFNNEPYTTHTPLRAREWADQYDRFQTYAYFDSGLVPSVDALGSAVKTLVDNIFGFLPADVVTGPALNALNRVTGVLSMVGSSGAEFKALPGDDGINLSADRVSATGLTLQVVAMASGSMSLVNAKVE